MVVVVKVVAGFVVVAAGFAAEIVAFLAAVEEQQPATPSTKHQVGLSLSAAEPEQVLA